MSRLRRLSARYVAHVLIRGYQLTLSPFIGRQCRYLPTCSEYTDTAIQRFGFWSGGWMGLARILRCNPWGGAGYDPVRDEIDPGYRWWRPWRGARWTSRHMASDDRLGG